MNEKSKQYNIEYLKRMKENDDNLIEKYNYNPKGNEFQKSYLNEIETKIRNKIEEILSDDKYNEILVKLKN